MKHARGEGPTKARQVYRYVFCGQNNNTHTDTQTDRQRPTETDRDRETHKKKKLEPHTVERPGTLIPAIARHSAERPWTNMAANMRRARAEQGDETCEGRGPNKK